MRPEPPKFQPIDFAVYALTEPYEFRWLHSVQRTGVEPPYGVWLGHASAAGDRVVIGSFTQHRLTRQVMPGEPLEQALAFHAMLALAGLMQPDEEAGEITRVAEASAANLGAWSSLVWNVDLVDVDARGTSAWAGRAGITTYGQSAIAVVSNRPLDGLVVSRAHGGDFGVDFTLPLEPQWEPSRLRVPEGMQTA